MWRDSGEEWGYWIRWPQPQTWIGNGSVSSASLASESANGYCLSLKAGDPQAKQQTNTKFRGGPEDRRNSRPTLECFREEQKQRFTLVLRPRALVIEIRLPAELCQGRVTEFGGRPALKQISSGCSAVDSGSLHRQVREVRLQSRVHLEQMMVKS